MLLHAHRMRPSPSVRDYTILAIFATLGLYTIPVMVYPIAVVAVWLSLDWWKRPDGMRQLVLLARRACRPFSRRESSIYQ
jgi:hypothetical protein